MKHKINSPLNSCKTNLTGFIPLEVARAKKNHKKGCQFLTGLTLIEILIALVIFVIISVVLGGIVIQMAALQERIVGRNQQISESRFALDYISGSIANARNPPMAGCIVLANANFETITGGIRFINADNRCQEIFFLSSPLVTGFGRIRTRISTDHTSANLATPIDLTSDTITRFNINLMGGIIGIADGQPRITISIASNIQGLDLPITTQRSVSRIKLDN